jgi:hypothetical protein
MPPLPREQAPLMALLHESHEPADAPGPASIVIAIVASIDLNTLDALARTSRRIHDALIQYRTGLIAATLRCANTGVAFDPSETFRFRARAGNWFYMEDGRNYNGKAGHCATDLVSECRRCATVICRVRASLLSRGGRI